MATEIKVPPLGESIVEATVGRWLKREGEEVAEGEPVVELETEKVNMEVTANGSGVLGEIVKAEGETVNIGDMLAVIASAADARQPVATRPARQRSQQPAPQPRHAPQPVSCRQRRQRAPASPPRCSCASHASRRHSRPLRRRTQMRCARRRWRDAWPRSTAWT